MGNEPQDIFIIGGGINGCGIARDTAGRGYSVSLAEMGDLASATSSASTKLIHGGLRYLEFYEFRLVREALKEREVLLANAPHIVWPLRFVLPHHKGLRPAWLLRLGLFLYDHIGGRKALPPTRMVDMVRDIAGSPLKPLFTKGFEYSDCWVNDARLVVLNAMDAAAHGAEILTRYKVVSTRYDGALWTIITRNQITGEERTHQARMLINAAGPWVDHVIGETLGHTEDKNVRLVQGSHIIVPKLFEHDRCYIFQNEDGRIIFAIPYEEDFTLVGTTDQDFVDDLDAGPVTITEGEIDYLCEAASEYFKRPLTPDQIISSFSGVRPLYDDGASAAQEATRDYVLRQSEDEHDGAVLHIFGGKITTYRKLAEAVAERIEDRLGARGPSWTRDTALPGGDFKSEDFDTLVASLRSKHPYLSQRHARRLVRLYGIKASAMLAKVESEKDFGAHFGADLYQVEVDYLVCHEWAMRAEDILYRRTKRGLIMNKDEIAALQTYMEAAHTHS